jgi:hypothetical protein
LKKIKQTFRDSTVIVTYSAPDQMNLQIDGIKYTFFFYEYSLIEKTKQFKGVPLASVLEIATMKAFSIGKRLSYKDYVDWYFLLTGSHVTLDQVIQSAKKKFAHDFNDRLFLGQLVSMSDIATQKIDFVGKEISKNQIETCLKKSVREFV